MDQETLVKLCAIQAKLMALEHAFILLNSKETIEMEQSTKDLITQLDQATDRVATKLQAVIDKATQQGQLSAAEVNAALQPEVDKLNALGQDPANPIPQSA